MAKELDRFGRNPIKPPAVSRGLSILLACIFLLCFGLVGLLDYQDEVLEAQHYCQMVYQKLWADYRGIYARECRGGHYVGKR